MRAGLSGKRSMTKTANKDYRQEKMRKKQDAIVISQTELAAGIYDLQLSAPQIAEQAQAGQFVNVYCADNSRLLPRPISLAGIDRGKGEIRLIYRVSGAGTEEFSRLQAGDAVEVLGPLGNGFSVKENLAEQTRKQVFLIGGGIGIPPLLETAKALTAEKKAGCNITAEKKAGCSMTVTAVLGYRDRNTFLADEFEAVCDRVLVASEDGSVGARGTVLDAMREAGVIPQKGQDTKSGITQAKEDSKQSIPQKKENEEKKPAGAAETEPVWFACGPTPMLRALKTCAAENGIACWLSLEERMACGVGACLACVCQTAEKDEHSQVKNRRVCKDGPVFRAEEIVL